MKTVYIVEQYIEDIDMLASGIYRPCATVAVCATYEGAKAKIDELGYREAEEHTERTGERWVYFPDEAQIVGPHSTIKSWLIQDFYLEA